MIPRLCYARYAMIKCPSALVGWHVHAVVVITIQRIVIILHAGTIHMAKRISVQAAKAKGRKFQQQIARDVSQLVNIPCGKDELIESREMGQAGVDLKLIGPARRVFPWSVEAKNDKSFQLKSWIRQASTNVMENTNWVVFFKKNHFKPVAVFDSAVFDSLFEQHLLETIEYSSLNWFVEKWVNHARQQSKDLWQIRLAYLERKVIMMEMSQFFLMLKQLETEIKGDQSGIGEAGSS